jgi:hypothetical protein
MQDATPHVYGNSISTMAAVTNSTRRVTSRQQSNADDRGSPADCVTISFRDLGISLRGSLPDVCPVKVQGNVRNAVPVP